MYQIEVKRYLVEHHFHPKDGWSVTVDLDAMEMGKGGKHPQGKRELALHHRNPALMVGGYRQYFKKKNMI
jgi:hypothetical protein